MVKRVGCRMTLYNVSVAAKNPSRDLACRATWRAWIIKLEGIGVDTRDNKPVRCRILGF